MTGYAVPRIPECAGADWVPAFFSPDFCRICGNGVELGGAMGGCAVFAGYFAGALTYFSIKWASHLEKLCGYSK